MKYYSFLLALMLVGCTHGKGLSESEKTDDGKEVMAKAEGIRIDKETFPDDSLRAFLLEQDFGRDSILTVEEQQEVDFLSLRTSGVRSLQGIELFPCLADLRMSDQKLGQLTMPPMENLYRLYLIDCQLTGLDVSQCPNLVELKCSKNQLTALDLSQLPKLDQLYADGNNLTDILLVGTDSVNIVDVQQNQLTGLDLSTQRNLHCVFIGDNPMDESQLDAFIGQLPAGVKLDTSWSDHIEFEEPYVNLGNRKLTDAQELMLEQKGWMVWQ